MKQPLANFQNEYASLNTAQKEAVDTIDGPVMVIAGPGTGKTQILAIRIGKILMDTDTLPENILCMTFTDSGAIAMRKRLLKMIGPDAYKVNIHTYHSFCNMVIQDNLAYFEKSSLEPISDLETAALLRELIDQFPKNHPLKRYRSDVYFEARNLRQLFSNMKKEGWEPPTILDAIEAYLNDLPTREEYVYKKKYKQFNAGDLKIELFHAEKERMNKLAAGVKEFDKFQKMMKDRRRYDFDDMINWVIRAFKEDRSILAQYQEQYQYVLVDEYQDTSGTQNTLVELLISYWQDPNIFVVGDDDQSIFRFQGANVENMVVFMKKFPNMRTIMLTENYRSIQPILDISKTLIDRNQERLVSQIEGLSKNLQTGKKELKGISHPPVIHAWRNASEEMIGITKAIEELVLGGVEPKRIAVIYRENKYGEELSAYLNCRNILFYSKRNLNLLNQPLVQRINRLLAYLDAEMDTPFSGDQMLFEILHYDWFGIHPIEIAKLCIENNERSYKKKPSGFRLILHEKANAIAQSLFEKNLSDEMAHAFQFIESLIGAANNITLQQLLEKIIRDSGMLGVIMNAADQHWQMQTLTAFFDFLKVETKKDPSLNLNQFVQIVNMMKSEEIILPIAQTGGNEKGVHLLTAHGSKGLEYEHVFIAGTNASFWEKKNPGSKGFKLPDTLFQAHADTSSDEELRRLFYVALTRAEKYLTISYAKQNEKGKDLEPSMFLEEIRTVHALPEEHPVPEETTMTEFNLARLLSTETPRIETMETEVVDRALEKFSMNVTALNNYLDCPLHFYYNNLIRIPSPKNETLEFGSGVHFALESLFNKMKADPAQQFPSKEDFIQDFILHLYRHRESFTKEEFERRMEYGKEILDRYYDKRIHGFNKIVSIERNIKNVVVDGIPLKGKIDKMEYDGHQVNVVDYKTGKPENGIKKLKNPQEEPPYGGDYWRQAVFYKLLIDNSDNGRNQVVSTEFDFIEPNEKKEIQSKKVNISAEDTHALREQIRMVWDKIQSRDFYTGCGEEDCHWCNFVKTNKLQAKD